MTTDEANQALDLVERSSKMSRTQNQEMIEGQLAASAIMVSQSAAMAAQAVLPKDFQS
jgi:hypothetical protein